MNEREFLKSVKKSIEVGNLHIDTDQYYGNKNEFWEEIRATKVPWEKN